MDDTTFSLVQDNLSQFKSLCSDGGFKSYEDLINNAFTLMVWVVRHVTMDHTVLALDNKTGETWELGMDFMRQGIRQNNILP